MSTPTTTPVTVLGLGRMGAALAAALVRAGHPTTVWNRTPGKAAALAADGATVASTAARAVAASPLVIVCLSDYDAVRAALAGADVDGRVLVNLSSGTSEGAREAAVWAGELGAVYLDGAILTVPAAIGDPSAQILFSGPAEAYAAHEAVFGALGTPVHLGADHGLASVHDVALLGLMWSMLNGFLHGAALARAAGVPAADFAAIAERGVGTVASWFAGYAGQVDERSYPDDDASLNTHLAAMDHLVHETGALGLDAGIPRHIKDLADRAVAAGHGGEGYAVLAELLFRS
ncbi:3-hydroxyisobutyrate dehydrogenase [Actinorhabdospora filicis]|uniref:3-hydroxyisobutyrate dehydrogenase n=1 Tax=Actinorhabdospora filicis TaxID=1785913 RepID=A0A9W6W369_9ACTN|nr:NAD(P)-binding domain-containing protein [Actinorhabdospora filicis]GLZ77812.1 3-hydroxyisobutyrate dehydrogenase [Actinorhabdospora filicis]